MALSILAYPFPFPFLKKLHENVCRSIDVQRRYPTARRPRTHTWPRTVTPTSLVKLARVSSKKTRNRQRVYSPLFLCPIPVSFRLVSRLLSRLASRHRLIGRETEGTLGMGMQVKEHLCYLWSQQSTLTFPPYIDV